MEKELNLDKQELLKWMQHKSTSLHVKKIKYAGKEDAESRENYKYLLGKLYQLEDLFRLLNSGAFTKKVNKCSCCGSSIENGSTICSSACYEDLYHI